MDIKSFSCNLKAADDAKRGEFTGYAAIYGNEDRNGDVIDKGAMKRSINNAEGEFPLLWQHERFTPIGVVRLEEVERGAKAFGRVSLESEMGRNAYSLMIPPEGFKRAALRDLSIGYLVHKEEMKDGLRHLKEIQIFEVSLVTVAANPKTIITGVKEQADQDDRLGRIELQLKVLEATLAENGIAIDPDIVHSMADSSTISQRPGNGSDDSGNSHSLSELLNEMSLYKVRRQLDERGNQTQGGLGRNQDPLGK